MKKGVLGNFTKFTEKNQCQGLFFNKVAETLAQVFSCEFCEICKNFFFTEHLWAAASGCSEKYLFSKIAIIKNSYNLGHNILELYNTDPINLKQNER